MNIDLGQKSDYPGAPVIVASPAQEPTVHYPSIYIRGGSELKAIPESGSITFRFKRVSKSERERDDKKTCELELECQAITDVTSDEKSDSGSNKSRDKIIDALKEKSADDSEEEGEEY